MLSEIDLAKFQELKELTEANYKKIGSIYCPALKSPIIFNSDGFHHLSYDGSRSERSKHVQQTKFRHLNYAVEIIKIATTVQEYRRSICPIGKKDKSGYSKTKTIEWFGFFSIVSFSKKIRINTVVRRIGGDAGNYHFWSVMPFWTLTNSHRIIGSKIIEDG